MIQIYALWRLLIAPSYLFLRVRIYFLFLFFKKNSLWTITNLNIKLSFLCFFSFIFHFFLFFFIIIINDDLSSTPTITHFSIINIWNWRNTNWFFYWRKRLFFGIVMIYIYFLMLLNWFKSKSIYKYLISPFPLRCLRRRMCYSSCFVDGF